MCSAGLARTHSIAGQALAAGCASEAGQTNKCLFFSFSLYFMVHTVVRCKVCMCERRAGLLTVFSGCTFSARCSTPALSAPSRRAALSDWASVSLVLHTHTHTHTQGEEADILYITYQSLTTQQGIQVPCLPSPGLPPAPPTHSSHQSLTGSTPLLCCTAAGTGECWPS